jgi:hypothetical protein
VSYDPWTWTVEFAPTFSPLDLPTEGDWVSLGTPTSFSIDRGRQDDLDEFESGTMTVVFDDADELLEQLDPSSVIGDSDALPFTPMRLRASRGPQTVTVFTGYTLDGFDPDGLRRARSVQVQVIDWLGWAETIEAPDSQWAAWVQRVGPSMWIRGLSRRVALGYTDSGGTNPAYNMASIFTGTNANMYGDPTYPDRVDQVTNQGQIVTGASNPHFAMGTAGTFGGLIMNVGDSLTQVGQWLAAAWFRTPDVQSMTWGGSDWTVSLNASGYLVATIDVGGFSQVATLSFNHADDEPHVWFLKVTSTGGSRSMRLSSDLGITNTVIGAAAVSGGGQLNFRGIGFADAIAADFVYFDGANLATVFALANEDGLPANAWCGPIANTILWTGDTLEERVTHAFQACAVGEIPTEVLVESAHTLSDYEPSSTLADDIRLVASSYLGAAYMLRDGTLRVRDFTMTSDNPFDFDTSTARISDESGASTWDATVSDDFTRANNVALTNGWTYFGLGGNIGVTSNTAYVSSAPPSVPVGYEQPLGLDVTIDVDFASVATGMGVMVRKAAGVSDYVSIEAAPGTVEVYAVVGGTATLLGDTGADALGAHLTVTVEFDRVTVQIDSGTVHEFTITDPELMVGTGVGLIYTNIGVLPAGSARWDNFDAVATRNIFRPVGRSRKGTRVDRVINTITVELPSSDVYVQDAVSQRRFGFRRTTIPSVASDKDTVADYADDLLAARTNPTVEIGDLSLQPFGNQQITDWAVRELELEKRVVYLEHLYDTGTELLSDPYRVTGERWDWANGTDWTITLKIVPA